MIAADPYVQASAVGEAGGELCALDTVLRESDFVVVCCLLTDETRHLMGDAQFELMKPTAFYLNVGRGPIHDEAALVRAFAR